MLEKGIKTLKTLLGISKTESEISDCAGVLPKGKGPAPEHHEEQGESTYWEETREGLGILEECVFMRMCSTVGRVDKEGRQKGSLKVEGAFNIKVTDLPVFLGLI